MPKLKNYQEKPQSRKHKRGGGLAFYIRTGIQHKEKTILKGKNIKIEEGGLP